MHGSKLITVNSTCATPTVMHKSKLIAKIPVVLAEPTVQVPIDTTFTLPTPTGYGVLEIKTIGKRLKLTQCLLALPSNILFIKGYVRKDIQYAEITGSGTSTVPAVQSDIIDYVLDIPFTFTADLSGKYLTSPVYPTPNSKKEFEYFTSTPIPASEPHSSKDHLLAGDLTQFDQTSNEYFNELPYCELVSASFIEYDEYLNRTTPLNLNNTPFEEGCFSQVEEKMVINFTLKILQKQQVTI